MDLFAKFTTGINRLGQKVPEDLVLLVVRLAMASVFWLSVQNKISGWEVLGQSLQFYNLSGFTLELFRLEYNVPLLPSSVAAYLATLVEFFGSLMLALGLGTRVAALGLIMLTVVIQFLVYPGSWSTHILWFAGLLVIFRYGCGRIALDNVRLSMQQ